MCLRSLYLDIFLKQISQLFMFRSWSPKRRYSIPNQFEVLLQTWGNSRCAPISATTYHSLSVKIRAKQTRYKHGRGLTEEKRGFSEKGRIIRKDSKGDQSIVHML